MCVKLHCTVPFFLIKGQYVHLPSLVHTGKYGFVLDSVVGGGGGGVNESGIC